ncbi:MAG TPA: hypothetical protein VGG58_01000 [Candidatus Acidoferrum sp.]
MARLGGTQGQAAGNLGDVLGAIEGFHRAKDARWDRVLSAQAEEKCVGPLRSK